jgi:hypothetical protein
MIDSVVGCKAKSDKRKRKFELSQRSFSNCETSGGLGTIEKDSLRSSRLCLSRKLLEKDIVVMECFSFPFDDDDDANDDHTNPFRMKEGRRSGSIVPNLHDLGAVITAVFNGATRFETSLNNIESSIQ